tara:strand:+ start:3007 stop:5646 length:2640 start_codon:yes stop_codon:yes gene_type:complete
MKKFSLKFFLLFLSFVAFIIIYLSLVGIETDKFNQQIKDKVIQSNKDLNIDLKKVKLTLDPLNFEINAKTIGAVIYYSNRPLELEYIQTKVSLDSVYKNKLVSSNFQIATKSILLKDLVRFTRSIIFRPELLILETIIKDGHIILDINLNLDENGKIKNDYEVNGILKEGKIKFLKDIGIRKINFLFNLKEKYYFFKDINFSADQVNFKSDALKIIKVGNIHQIEGKIENSKSILSKNIARILNINFKNLGFENTKFSTKNNFIFEIDNRFKFKNLKLESEINFNEMIYKNDSTLSDYFPDIKKNFLLKNHNLKLEYEKNILLVNGMGKIKIGDNTDQIEYLISKNNGNLEFETNLNLKKITLKNQKLFKTNFPSTKDLIDLKDHKINIKYKDSNLYLSGKGKLKIEKEFDNIEYFFLKNKDDFEFKSEVDLKNINLKNKKFLKNFFPKTKSLLNLKNHKIKINYRKNSIFFSGKGKIKIDNYYDDIDYFIAKEKDEINFDVNANLNKTDFKIKNINYQKNDNFNTKLNISGRFLPNEKLILNKLNVLEKSSKIQITNLVFDKDYLLIKLDEGNFDYIDTEDKENQFLIKRKENNNYKLNGLFFNANSIVTNLLEGEGDNVSKFFKNKINIILNLNEVYLDEINFIKNLQGSVLMNDNKVLNANFSANFDSRNNIIFTINTKDNGEKITKFYSSKAEPLVKRYKFIKGFDEGYLDFTSIKKDKKSISNLKIYEFKLKELPILTKLLTLASLQGIADILTGEGIRFDEFEMNFNIEKNLMTIDEIYAIGPAISILMKGYIEKDKLISLRGTLVPATTINKTISKIPLLGKILVGDKTGEGVFGVSFKIKGHPKNLETTVNPIKTLTPRFITRTLDKIKKN